MSNLTYHQAVRIVEKYREAPRNRAEQLTLLQMAGYDEIKERKLSMLPFQELYQVAKKTRELAQKTIKDFLVNEAAHDQYKKLNEMFGYKPNSKFAPDPEELEGRLLD